MPVVSCPGCRTRYRVPESVAGKRTTCKRCGQPFRIPAPRAEEAGVLSLAPEESRSSLGFGDLSALDSGEAVAPPVHARAAPSRNDLHVIVGGGSLLSEQTALAANPEAVTGEGYAAFVGAVLRSVICLAKPRYLVTFVLLWAMFALQLRLPLLVSPLGCIGLIGSLGLSLLITAWYLSFMMGVVQHAAAGEDELPSLNPEEGIWDGVLRPAFRMFATQLCCGLPPLIYFFVLVSQLAGAVTPGALAAGLIPTPAAASVVVLILLIAMGVFVWPILVLVVSCGESVAGLFRLDLIIETIVRSFPAYLLTLIAVYAAVAANLFLASVALDGLSPGSSRGSILGVTIALTGLKLFLDIFGMRAIGLYYCCFKDKFAWSWG